MNWEGKNLNMNSRCAHFAHTPHLFSSLWCHVHVMYKGTCTAFCVADAVSLIAAAHCDTKMVRTVCVAFKRRTLYADQALIVLDYV